MSNNERKQGKKGEVPRASEAKTPGEVVKSKLKPAEREVFDEAMEKINRALERETRAIDARYTSELQISISVSVGDTLKKFIQSGRISEARRRNLMRNVINCIAWHLKESSWKKVDVGATAEGKIKLLEISASLGKISWARRMWSIYDVIDAIVPERKPPHPYRERIKKKKDD